MKKTDKKIEKAIVSALTEVCEIALGEVAGFKWLTHQVDYRRLPDSLIIICIFDTKAQLAAAIKSGKDDYLHRLIKVHMQAALSVNKFKYQLKLDTEEACELENAGKWHERL